MDEELQKLLEEAVNAGFSSAELDNIVNSYNSKKKKKQEPTEKATVIPTPSKPLEENTNSFLSAAKITLQKEHTQNDVMREAANIGKEKIAKQEEEQTLRNEVNKDNFILNPNPLTDGLLNISIKYGAPWFYVVVPGGLTDSDGLPLLTLIPRIRVNITIFNQSGNLVQSYTNRSMPTQLNLSDLPQGTYIVLFEFQGQLESYTIIKN